MKRLLFVTFAVFLSVNLLSAQGKQLKEGKVTYAISLPDSGGDESTMMAASMMGKEQVIYFKDSNSRAESKTSMGDVVVISNAKTGETYTLMNMMGQKIALKLTDEDMSAMKEMINTGKPDIKITNEKKKICGYKCTKAIITLKSEGKTFTSDAWFTDEIASLPGSSVQNKIEGINGFMMEFSTTNKGVTMKMTCTAVEATPVSSDMFKVPDDYTIKSMSDMMGGMH